MKIHVKKKLYRRWCQQQLKAGYVASAEAGAWTTNTGKNAQERDARAGVAH